MASHIVPWATDSKNRLNPRNGLCLNAIHDRAFDRGILTITPDYKVILSSRLTVFTKEDSIKDLLLRYDGVKIRGCLKITRLRPKAILDCDDIHRYYQRVIEIRLDRPV